MRRSSDRLDETSHYLTRLNLPQTKYAMACSERKTTISTCHLDASTPTTGDLPCHCERALPTTTRYLRTNYHNRSHQMRYILVSSFPLLLLYKREDVRSKNNDVLSEIWLLLHIRVHARIPINSFRLFFIAAFYPPLPFLPLALSFSTTFCQRLIKEILCHLTISEASSSSQIGITLLRHIMVISSLHES